MAKQVKCDRCGSIDVYSAWTFKHSDEVATYADRDYDLCETCGLAVRDYITALKVATS